MFKRLLPVIFFSPKFNPILQISRSRSKKNFFKKSKNWQSPHDCAHIMFAND